MDTPQDRQNVVPGETVPLQDGQVGMIVIRVLRLWQLVVTAHIVVARCGR